MLWKRWNCTKMNNKNFDLSFDRIRILSGSTSYFYLLGGALLSCGIIFFFISSVLAFLIFCSIGFGEFRNYFEKPSNIFFMFFIFLLAIFYSIQDNLLFYPDIGQHRTSITSPDIFSLPFEVVYIKTRDKVTLHSYFIRHPETKGTIVPTFVYFHGNAGNIGGRLQNTYGIYHNLQCNILLVGEWNRLQCLWPIFYCFSLVLEYRGYGLSSGSPSEKGIYIDARAAIDYLFTRHDVDHSQIVLFGRSLGGAVVSCLILWIFVSLDLTQFVHTIILCRW